MFIIEQVNKHKSEKKSKNELLFLFYDNAPAGRHGSMTYLADAIFKTLPEIISDDKLQQQ